MIYGWDRHVKGIETIDGMFNEIDHNFQKSKQSKLRRSRSIDPVHYGAVVPDVGPPDGSVRREEGREDGRLRAPVDGEGLSLIHI